MTVCAVIMKLLSILVLLVALLSAAHGQGEMDSLFIVHILSYQPQVVEQSDLLEMVFLQQLTQLE